MHRRDFITTVGVLSLASVAGEMARAAERSFDPTEQSMAALQAAMASGTTSAEALTAAYMDRIARYDHAGPEHRSVLSLNSNAGADARALDRQRKAGKLPRPAAWHPHSVERQYRESGSPADHGRFFRVGAFDAAGRAAGRAASRQRGPSSWEKPT